MFVRLRGGRWDVGVEAALPSSAPQTVEKDDQGSRHGGGEADGETAARGVTMALMERKLRSYKVGGAAGRVPAVRDTLHNKTGLQCACSAAFGCDASAAGGHLETAHPPRTRSLTSYQEDEGHLNRLRNNNY